MVYLQRRFSVIGLAPLAAMSAVLGVASPASATVYSFVANLDGLQETPPNASPATGFAELTLDDSNGHFDITSGSYQGLLAGANFVSIKLGDWGHNGPTTSGGGLTLDNFGSTTGTFSGSGTLTIPAGSDPVGDMIAGNTYIEIGSHAFPSGEIRGQILLATPEPTSLGLMAVGGLAFIVRRRKMVT